MKDNARPRTHTTDPGPSHVYPPKIRLTPGAERYLEQLGHDLVTGDVDLNQLPPSILQLYTFAFEQGRQSLQPALDQANADADRIYVEMCRRPPAPNPTAEPGWKTYEQLARQRRGDH